MQTRSKDQLDSSECMRQSTIRIQRWFRDAVQVHASDKGSAYDDYDAVCKSCGNSFVHPSSGGEYDGDRCDICASPFHATCMPIRHDLRGEWVLCSECAATSKIMVGDFREVPDTFWAKLYSIFSSDHARVGGRRQEDREQVPKAVELRQTLHSRMDYMIRYLEMDSTGVISQYRRTAILERVRAT